MRSNFFSRLVTERQQVKTALKRLHDKESGALRKRCNHSVEVIVYYPCWNE